MPRIRSRRKRSTCRVAVIRPYSLRACPAIRVAFPIWIGFLRRLSRRRPSYAQVGFSIQCLLPQQKTLAPPEATSGRIFIIAAERRLHLFLFLSQTVDKGPIAALLQKDQTLAYRKYASVLSFFTPCTRTFSTVCQIGLCNQSEPPRRAAALIPNLFFA